MTYQVSELYEQWANGKLTYSSLYEVILSNGSIVYLDLLDLNSLFSDGTCRMFKFDKDSMQVFNAQEIKQAFNYKKSLEPFNGIWASENYGLSRRVVDWLHMHLNNYHSQAINFHFKPVKSGQLSEIIYAYFPNKDKDDENINTIFYWPNMKARDKGRSGRISTRPGRLFRKMFPWLDNTQVESLVDEYKRTFGKREYTLKTGKDRDSFKHMYTHKRAMTENVYTTSNRKLLRDSCMRYEFENLPHHPVEAYASGDFLAIWLEDNEGNIAGRTVYYEQGKIAGPVYGVCEHALDKLYHYVENDLGGAVGGNWSGAKLLKIEFGGGYIAPYVDLSPQSVRSHCDKYFEFISGGEYDLDSTYGTLDVYMCCCCEEHATESHDDESYCESCFNERFMFCERYQEYQHNFEAQHVYVSRTRSEHWCESAVDSYAVYCDNLGEYVDADLVTYCEFESIYVAQWESGYFVSDGNGELYPESERVETDKESISKDEYEERKAA